MKTWHFPALAALLFLALGCAVIPYLGAQADETLFAQPWYTGDTQQKLMLLPYLGTLKTWLYYPFRLWAKPSVWALRVPALLTGCATLVIFFGLLRRFLGSVAPAAAGLAILTTDPVFVLCHAFDWGPVSLHLLLWVGFLRAFEANRYALAGLCAGLGLWNKAVFIWNLGGFGVAILVLYWRPLWTFVRSRALAVFLAFFVAGIAPLIWYNLITEAATKTAVRNFGWDAMNGKVSIVAHTLTGDGLFGYLTPRPAQAQSANFLLIPAIALAALVAWRGAYGRAVAAALLCAFVTWFQMAIGRETGGSVHHAILLWPIPAFVIACGLALLPRPAIATVTLALCSLNLFVWSQYFRQLRNEGAMSSAWTDASTPLVAKLQESKGSVVAADWGILEPARYLTRSRIELHSIAFELYLPSDDASRAVEQSLKDEDSRFVLWAAGQEQFKGNGAKLDAAAAKLGLHRVPLATIADRLGRPAFEVVRYMP